MTRLMKMNATEWPYIVIGCIMALAQGAVQPAFALIFAIMLGVSNKIVLCCLYPVGVYEMFQT